MKSVHIDHLRAAYRWYRENTIKYTHELAVDFDISAEEMVRKRRRHNRKSTKVPPTPLEMVEAASELFEDVKAHLEVDYLAANHESVLF